MVTKQEKNNTNPSSPIHTLIEICIFFSNPKKISNSINLAKEIYGIHTKWWHFAEKLNLKTKIECKMQK